MNGLTEVSLMVETPLSGTSISALGVLLSLTRIVIFTVSPTDTLVGEAEIFTTRAEAFKFENVSLRAKVLLGRLKKAATTITNITTDANLITFFLSL